MGTIGRQAMAAAAKRKRAEERAKPLPKLTAAQRRVLAILAGAKPNVYYTYLLARQYKAADVLVGLGLAERVSRYGGYRVTEDGRSWQLRGGGGTMAGSKSGAARNVGRKRTREPDPANPPVSSFHSSASTWLALKNRSDTTADLTG